MNPSACNRLLGGCGGAAYIIVIIILTILIIIITSIALDKPYIIIIARV